MSRNSMPNPATEILRAALALSLESPFFNRCGNKVKLLRFQVVRELNQLVPMSGQVFGDLRQRLARLFQFFAGLDRIVLIHAEQGGLRHTHRHGQGRRQIVEKLPLFSDKRLNIKHIRYYRGCAEKTN